MKWSSLSSSLCVHVCVRASFERTWLLTLKCRVHTCCLFDLHRVWALAVFCLCWLQRAGDESIIGKFHIHDLWLHKFVVDAGCLTFFKNSVVCCCLRGRRSCHVCVIVVTADRTSFVGCVGYMAVWLYGHPTSLNVKLCIHFPSISGCLSC